MDFRKARLWAIPKGRLLCEIALPCQSFCQAFSPDGKLLATGHEDYTVRLWDTRDGTEIRALEGAKHYVYSVAFSPDGRLLAAGDAKGTVTLWDIAEPTPLSVFDGHTEQVAAVAFSPTGVKLASASYDATVRLWDVATGVTAVTIPRMTLAVSFDPSGRMIATGTFWDETALWDTGTGQLIAELYADSLVCNMLCFSPNGKTLAGGAAGRIRLWTKDNQEWSASEISCGERD
jgi:WD40 repeat protein